MRTSIVFIYILVLWMICRFSFQEAKVLRTNLEQSFTSVKP